jgi:hypothetical protein
MGWGAAGGLREAAFVDEFGPNGLKFSICQTDFSASMKGIGDAIARKLQNLCIDDKLLDTDANAAGLQPNCRVVYSTPQVDPRDPTKVIYVDSPSSLPTCPAGATSGNVSGDCWQLTNDTAKCPVTGVLVQVLRTAQEVASGPLTPGTQIRMQCEICPATSSADPIEGCAY